MADNNINPDAGTRNWTKFVTVANNKPVSITTAPLTFRTSGGNRPSDEWLASDGYRGYIDNGPPSYNKWEQKVVKTPLDKLPIQENNLVVQTYSVIALTSAEKEPLKEDLKGEINAEREKRIAAGSTITIANVGDVFVEGSAEDMRNLTNLGQLANLQLLQNNTTPIPFRDGTNTLYSLTPAQMAEIWLKSVSYVSALYQASWTMKEMNPLPQDYTKDSYWPSPNR